MCLNPIKVGKHTYPCGKCPQCVRTRQLDYTQIMMRQSEKKGSCHFVTFTYDDLNIPIKCLDVSTGEIGFLSDLLCFSSLGEDERNVLREMYQVRILKDEKRPYNRFYHVDLVTSFGVYKLVYSLCRRDFRLWLKRARVRYERKFGKKLSDFTYCCFGEYGERSWRPHYHCNFYGLKDDEVNFMVSDWKNNYGYVLVKKVSSFSSADIARVCMYVGKYVSKGHMDCPELLKEGSLMEKPRPLISCGMSVQQGILSLFTLDGKLGIYQHCYLVEDIERIVQRMSYNIGNTNLFIGKHFYYAALRVPNDTYKQNSFVNGSFYDYEYQTSFYVKNFNDSAIEIGEKPHELSTCRFKASPLQLAISHYLRNMALQRTGKDGLEQIKTFDYDPTLREVYGEFNSYLLTLQSSEKEDASRKRQKDVSKSVF